MRPSSSTRVLSGYRSPKPRVVTDHLLASISATSSPGTVRSNSAMLLMPERRMSSLVMTKIAAAASIRVCSFLETDVISIDDRLSRLRLPTSEVGSCALPSVSSRRMRPMRNPAPETLFTRARNTFLPGQPVILPTLCGGREQGNRPLHLPPMEDSCSSIRRRGRQLNDAEVATPIWDVLSR